MIEVDIETRNHARDALSGALNNTTKPKKFILLCMRFVSKDVVKEKFRSLKDGEI